jgi:tricorn protease-like protein
MPATGGTEERLTYLGANSYVANWSSDGEKILFSTNANQPFRRLLALHSIDSEGGLAQPLPLEVGRNISYSASGGIAIGRYYTEPARWKRYRGGTAGFIWVDAEDKEKEPEQEKITKIDLDGIEDRVIAFPLSEGRYGQIHGIAGKALFTSFQVSGSLGSSSGDDNSSPKSSLEM